MDKRILVVIGVVLWCLLSLPLAHAQDRSGEDQIASNTVIIQKRGSVASAGTSHQHTVYLTDNTVNFDGLTIGDLTVYGSVNDITVNELVPTYTYGNCTYFKMGMSTTPGKEIYSLIQFSLNNIPAGATIDSVTLKFCSDGTYNENLDVNFFQVTEDSAHTWTPNASCATTETAPNWTQYSGANTWDTAGVAVSATVLATWDVSACHTADQWCEMAETGTNLKDYVTAVVGGTTDLGIKAVSTGSPTQTNQLHSCDSTDGKRPYLKVVYTH